MLGGYGRQGGLTWAWRTWYGAPDILSVPWVLWQWYLPESIGRALRARS